ncbi:HAD family phosphatase [Sinorhizobium sp. NFACC03]|uniref:HAD family hydrolase n=1 Tax=Sinorhizobium sp. NFACC03 TaxID=1566295 RepID=UPI00088937C2|nr:HAD family phosphatase [Sinorhizobium sp. NFACC03]SDA61730.1 haloacid dehalogenase superfamily, subfamily IA, variant 3 with third motif having DD or ED [Sinorhizobium sp. NFACC03]
MIKAVLWDMDGTLVDSEGIAVSALALAMEEEGLTPPTDLMQRVVGRSADEIYRDMVNTFGLRASPLEWERRKHHFYFRAADQLRGYDDAVLTWHRLDAANIRQAVVSNSDRAIVDVNLRVAGLARPGLVTVARNDVLRGKPDPEGYLRAAYLLGVEPRECLIVEDSASGAAAALSAGIETVFVPHSHSAAPAGVRTLSSMSQLQQEVLEPV